MKKRLILLGLILSLSLSMSLLYGCGNVEQEEPETLNIQDFFPLDGNARYVYEGIGNEYASYEVFTDYASLDKIQQRVDNGGTVMAQVFQVKDGKVTRLLSKGETYYRENFLDVSSQSEEILLMEPLEKGTSWILEDGRKREIASIDAMVSIPLGTYEAIEVVTTGENGTTRDYYSEGTGLVKTVFEYDGSEVSSSLKEIENNATRTQLIQFYFPNVDLGKIFIKNKEVPFKTNYITSQVLEEAYKSAIVSNVGEVFTTNTKINKLFLNEDEQVEIDLNSAFLSEMNAGAQYESMILQSIANTFGNYYGVDDVILTIDGKPYSSGHIEFKEGESIRVNYENTEEIEV